MGKIKSLARRLRVVHDDTMSRNWHAPQPRGIKFRIDELDAVLGYSVLEVLDSLKAVMEHYHELKVTVVRDSGEPRDIGIVKSLEKSSERFRLMYVDPKCSSIVNLFWRMVDYNDV